MKMSQFATEDESLLANLGDEQDEIPAKPDRSCDQEEGFE